ncbi:MAG: type IV pilus modification protein PilV [Venatoribacter sp.]
MHSIKFFHQRGINMIELLVTLAVTSIGLLGLNSLQLQANRTAQDSGSRSQALWIIEDLTNRMRANAIAVADYHTGTTKVACSTPSPKICAANPNGAAASDCSNTEMAKSDLFEVACGFRPNPTSSNNIYTSAIDYLANPELTVTINGSKATIKLIWDVRTGGLDNNGNRLYHVENEATVIRKDTMEREIQL